MSLEEDWTIDIAGYRLLKHLGGGGFGTVFLCSYDGDPLLRVVKILHQMGYDPERRFEREIRILQEASNDKFVKILDFGVTHQGLRFYAMEYCPLGDIRKLVGHVNVDFAWKVLSHICFALEPFHTRDGFHRDIKPDNILISHDPTGISFKLGDFGLAQDNNTSSVFTNNAAGTLGYIAPEVIGGGPYTPASDIYSLGVTLKELLTGGINKPMTDNILGDLRPIIGRMIIREPERRLSLSRLQQISSNRISPKQQAKAADARLVLPSGRLNPEF